jgi:serine/threonine-protein kinase
MELLDGFDLDSLIKRVGPIEPSRTIHILRQACHSLAEAHEKGLIHRDIKPANIYVCRYGRDVDFVKVLDFGLVKHRREPAAEDPRLTAENTTSGTPAFMAPEQILGNLPIDGRTDIYALGCVAYWLLTGQMVFEGATPMEFMMHHAKTAPVPPSRRTETHIPADLEAVILACLEKDPGRRPRSADDLARRIDACAAAGGWNAESARSWWQTHRPAAARVDHAGAGAAGAFGEAERLPIP